jgi:stage II sporulation protein D
LPPLTRGGALGSSVTFYGRGYGHGVGMSQWGARGRAEAGQNAPTILAHYYAGTTLGTVSPTMSVRVLVLDRYSASATRPLVIYGRGGTWTIDGISGTWPADARVTVVPTTIATASGTTRTWRVRITAATGERLLATTRCCNLRLRVAISSTQFQVWSKPSTYDTYRGSLRVTGTTRLSVINAVPLDLYLRGVVPAEMPYSWPIQALDAQAIAARSYAVRHLHPTTGTYDVHDDTRSQVYRGSKAERSRTTVAIETSEGVVLKSGTVVVNALFHSAGGGATESNRYAFPTTTGTLVAGQLTYLTGSADRAPDGTPYDAGSTNAAWHTKAYSAAALSAIFATDARTSVGALSRIDLLGRGVSGRLYRIRLVGSTGTKTVSGDVFRAVFNAHRLSGDPTLRSTLIDFRPIP